MPILLSYLNQKYVGNLIGDFIHSIKLTLLLPASAITNIISNFPNIPLFDLSFWSFNYKSWIGLLLFFSIQGVITATFLAIFRKQEYRTKCLFFLLIFYVLHIINRFYIDFNMISNNYGIKLGKGWYLTFLEMFLPVIISITLIYYISIKLNYKSLFIIILRYILLFLRY